MNKFNNIVNIILTRNIISKFVAYFLLIGFFYILSDFLGIFLLTFIFGYLFLSIAHFFKLNINKLITKKIKSAKLKKKLKNIFCLNLLIVIIYSFFIGIIVFIISDIVPKLIVELSELPKNMPFLSEPINLVTNTLVEIKNFKSEIGGTIDSIISNQDMELALNIFNKLKTASAIFLEIMLSLVLSFIFLIDRDRLGKYLLGIKRSNFKFLYKEYKIIFNKIVLSFGLILKAQSMIALSNSILTIIGLAIIGYIHGGVFPYLLTLGLIVFIAGFIPILGVFISSLPIIFIAYSIIGGYTVVFEIILLILIVHLIEAYYLNPKIISKFLEIPVSLTFLILIISEHLFGISGLIIGISLFYFIVGLLRDIDKGLKKSNMKKIVK